MKKRILKHLREMEELLESAGACEDLKQALAWHLTQISFFQHERLIHLIVTVTFAILTMLSVFVLFLSFQPVMLLLTLALLVLLIPYIGHYYLLENSVQRMYEQYDRLLALIRQKER